jgi:hypothetical protein
MRISLPPRRLYRFAAPVAIAAAFALGTPEQAQNTQSAPATDSSAQASPLKPAPAAPVNDSASQASPIGPAHTASAWIAPHTALHVRLSSSIDSGRLKNGQTVSATLAGPVSLSPRGSLPPGTPATLTVVETLPAGRIYAAGEFSLQVLRVGSVPVFTDTLTYRGQPGHKDLPDSAPSVGTDAALAAGAELTFHVQPPPAPASGPPAARGTTPGSVNGMAPGTAPHQPATPDNTKPTGSTQPR